MRVGNSRPSIPVGAESGSRFPLQSGRLGGRTYPSVKKLTPDELIQAFQECLDWEERYDFLLELGDQLEPLPEAFRVEENRVQGCVSNVWVVGEVVGEPSTRLRFLADSDAQIVRGLVAVLVMLMDDKSPKEILQLDLEGLFRRLELDQHLSRSRSNGLASMIRRMRQLAQTAESTS